MIEVRDPSEYEKPSPAPWEVGWKNGLVIFDANDKVVARVAAIIPDESRHPSTTNRDTSARLKNARLIAAAPELLRLLEVMTAYADRSWWKDPRVYNDDELRDEYDNAIREAERVIKKARGESND